jgi:hypothetical protein
MRKEKFRSRELSQLRFVDDAIQVSESGALRSVLYLILFDTSLKSESVTLY